jgi:RHS repeat-associated protein
MDLKCGFNTETDNGSVPFGGERTPIKNSCPQNYKFTSKERDSESGLDNFRARYNSAQFGRLLSPDPSGLSFADLSKPQSLNLYAYVRNNPLSFVDPTGLGVIPAYQCGVFTLCGFGQLLSNFFSSGDSGFGPPSGFFSELWSNVGALQQKTPWTQQLKFRTVSGGQTADDWEIRSSLTHNSKSGGWIVQHIVADLTDTGHYSYREASWDASAIGIHRDVYGQVYNHDFVAPVGSHAHANARFYKGLALPSTFRILENYPSGILRATTTNPDLPTENATAPNVRWWMAK